MPGVALVLAFPALFMGIAIVSFFSGTALYRFQRPGGSHITRMCQVLVAACRKWNVHLPLDSNLLYETQDEFSAIEGSRKLLHTNELQFLDKAAVYSNDESIASAGAFKGDRYPTEAMASTWKLANTPPLSSWKAA